MAVGVCALLGFGVLQTGGLTTATSGSSSAAAGSADASSATAASSAASPSSVTVQATVSPATDGPHPGTLDVYEDVPLGATTEDPAVAYDTTSYEPILNVYQTLLNYNGSSTSTYVPTLATCVPLQGDQCAEDYGAGFTGVFNATGGNFTGTNGEPLYWSFVIDPAAHFYDPSTGASWQVYPSDVMFSIARTLGWSTYPYATKTAGWILAQSLLQYGNAKWDNGLHFPFNNTPANVLGSMMVNDSQYCPEKAMNGVDGNGCITFIANGSGQYWTEFLDFVADNLGGSVVPCGWYTYEDAGLPGWSGTHAAKGDGACALPDGGTTTNSTTWTTYLAGLSPTGWDTFIQLNAKYPAPQPNVQWGMVGSGPYYASINPHLSYALAANPKYEQPSGCSGANGLAVYTGYCDPAPGKYIPNVDVTWETAEEGDSLGTDAIEAGTADFAGIATTETTTLLGYVHSGLWTYDLFPTLSDAFTTINLGISYSAYNTTFAGTPLEANPISPTLFSSIGLRNFYIAAYPYTTIENTINTVDGIQFSFNAGGPIPEGMGSVYGSYYPSNVTWPYEFGNPTQNSGVVGSAAWWWSELTTPGTPYYNVSVATKCTPSNPCTWPIGYYDGAPANLPLVEDWAAEVYDLSGHRLAPWPLALSFTTFLTESLVGAYESPLASVVGFGWAPDYPDPTDYVAAITAPDSDYTGPDTVANQLFLPQYAQNATCGHNGTANATEAFANLTYWAKQAQNPAGGAIDDACEGTAYGIASYFMTAAGALLPSSERILEYNLVEQITTALGLYVWQGQTNELIGFAPWINPSTINENPMIGGGGDLIWYQVHYRSVYTTTVTESGLPSGTHWAATFANNTIGSTGTSISFPPLPNGTYNFSVAFSSGYTVSPTGGTITLSGAGGSKTVAYTAFPAGTKTADVTFTESGLATNTTWALLLTGYGTLTTSSTSVTVPLPVSGTYAYSPQAVVGYRAPAASSVTLGTSPTSVALDYGAVFNKTYAVTFVAAGLSSGASWSVSVGPAGALYTITSTSPTITAYEINGTLVYRTSASGYSVAPSSGTVVLSGVPQTVVLSFTKATPWDYLSPLADALIGVLALTTIVGFVVAARRGGGRSQRPPTTWSGEQAPSSTAEPPSTSTSPPPSGPAPPST